MKKGLKIAGIVLGGIVLLSIIGIAVAASLMSRATAAPDDYYKTVETGGEIEGRYIANGSFEVSHYEEPSLQGFGKYEVFYPTELAGRDSQYPVVVFANGSGTPATKYPALLRHMASWGFIAIGTEEEFDWNGFASEMCIRHLIKLNESETIDDKKNVFYGKVDLTNVGITGHSQGGVGVINAITVQEHKDIYKAAVSLSPTNKELAAHIEWAYDATKVNTPIMLVSGASGGDDWVVTGAQLSSIYDDIAGNKIVMRRKDTQHGPMLYSADGYVTAWFMWHLQGDEEAAKAFAGGSPEIMSNDLYQDQHSDY